MGVKLRRIGSTLAGKLMTRAWFLRQVGCIGPGWGLGLSACGVRADSGDGKFFGGRYFYPLRRLLLMARLMVSGSASI